MEACPDRYDIIIAGKPAGPYTLTELRGMSLLPTDFIKPSGYPEFRELQEWPELSRLFQIKHQPVPPQYFAALDTRLLGTAIDYFIALCCYAILATVYLACTENIRDNIPALIGGLMLVPIIKFVLSVVLEGSGKQASVGKMLVGIKVTDTQGRPINYGRALLRNIAKLTAVATLGMGFLAGFFDRRQRCWHDRLAGTLVIKDRLI